MRTTANITSTSQPISIKKTTCLVSRPGRAIPPAAGRWERWPSGAAPEAGTDGPSCLGAGATRQAHRSIVTAATINRGMGCPLTATANRATKTAPAVLNSQ